MTIYCKTTLLTPEPAWSGLRVWIDVPDDDPTWGTFTGTLAEGHEKVTVDWGDGSQEPFAAITQTKHTYAKGGRYEVTFSDDLYAIRFGHPSPSSPFTAKYAPRIKKVEFRNSMPMIIAAMMFKGAVNMETVLSKDGNIEILQSTSFSGTASLAGRLDFPQVRDIETGKPFSGSPLVTEIHFSKAHEASIKASAGWQADPERLGAEKATIFFD